MELQFENKTCRYLRRSARDIKEQEQTQEVRLPDGMPDIGTVLGAWGQCVMRSKEMNGDSFGTSGGVMAWVLYAPVDGSQPRTVEVWLPVQMKWSLPTSQRAGTIRCSWLLKGVDGRSLSARKMMVRANVSVLGEVLEHWEEEIASAAEVPEDVQLLKNTYPARLPVEAGEKTFLIDEDVTGMEPMPDKIISCAVTPQITEQKVLGGKAVFHGTANLHLVYQDAQEQVHSHHQQMDFSQFVDLDRDYGSDAQVNTLMALSTMEPELQEGRLRIKCGMIAQYLISDLMMLELVEDAYSPSRQISMETRELTLPMMLDSRQENLRYSCTIPQNAARFVDVSVNMEQPAVRRAGELTQIVCNGQAQTLFYNDNGELQGAVGRWNAEWELPASMDAEMLACVQGYAAPQVSGGGGQIDLSGEVQMEATALMRQGLPMVTGLDMGEKAKPDVARPSLILRRAGEMPLWEIAKAAGSTVSAIQKANGLTGEPVDDRLLLIPVV